MAAFRPVCACVMCVCVRRPTGNTPTLCTQTPHTVTPHSHRTAGVSNAHHVVTSTIAYRARCARALCISINLCAHAAIVASVGLLCACVRLYALRRTIHDDCVADGLKMYLNTEYLYTVCVDAPTAKVRRNRLHAANVLQTQMHRTVVACARGVQQKNA